MPHHKADSKMDSKSDPRQLNEVCELKSCNGCLYLEARKRTDLYLWLARPPRGPSAKFLVQNVHTMDELKLTGNCGHGTRALLCFDATFDAGANAAFVDRVAALAESEGHHPDILLHDWNRVRLSLWTHAIGGLSLNDFILAAKIDGL